MATGRIYTVVFEEVAVTAAQDLWEIVAPADAVVILQKVTVSQSSDAGDSADEQLNILFHLGSTSGSGGSTPTARPRQTGSPAFGGTIETNNTTQSTEGNQLEAESWNIRNGYVWLPTPDDEIVISPSDTLIIELQTAPADSLTMSGTATIQELGG